MCGNAKPSWNNKYKWCVNIYTAAKWKIVAKRGKEKNCGRKSTNYTTAISICKCICICEFVFVYLYFWICIYIFVFAGGFFSLKRWVNFFWSETINYTLFIKWICGEVFSVGLSPKNNWLFYFVFDKRSWNMYRWCIKVGHSGHLSW